MYYEFYIDQFFAEHLLTGYLLLSGTARLLGEHISWKRLAAGSIANAALVTVLLLAGVPSWYFCGMVLSGALVFYRRRGKEETDRRDRLRKLLRSLAMLLFATFCFGGVMEAALGLWRLPAVFGAVLASVALTWAAGWQRRGEQAIQKTVTSELWWDGASVCLTAIIDTGNRLKEPLTGQPVSIVDMQAVQELLGEDWESRKGFYLVPYHSLGTEKGWMRAVTADRLCVKLPGGTVQTGRPVIALYEGSVAAAGAYRMILHPEHVGMWEAGRRRRHAAAWPAGCGRGLQI